VNRHTPESIAKMLASRKRNRLAREREANGDGRAARAKQPDLQTAIILLKRKVRSIEFKPYRDLDENELTILGAYNALTRRGPGI
jgi:hypothetical protein